MKLPNLNKIGNDIYKWTAKHSPELLTGIGIVGMLSAVVLAIKATPAAIDNIEQKKKEEEKEELELIEVIQVTWKCYIPTAVTSVVSVACIIGASAVNHKRNVALATAYSLVDNSFRTYKEKVVEAIGEKKEHEIRDEAAKEQLNKSPAANKEVVLAGTGETLCYEPITGRYFKCAIEKLHRVERDLNKELYSTMFVSLNEYFDRIGLKEVDIGDDLGWDVNKGSVEFQYTSQLTEDNVPCLVVSFTIGPRWDYRSMY